MSAEHCRTRRNKSCLHPNAVHTGRGFSLERRLYKQDTTAVHGDPGNLEFAGRKITSSRSAGPHKVVGQPQKYREILSPDNQVI